MPYQSFYKSENKSNSRKRERKKIETSLETLDPELNIPNIEKKFEKSSYSSVPASKVVEVAKNKSKKQRNKKAAKEAKNPVDAEYMDPFARISQKANDVVGSSMWFSFSVFLVFIWGVSGFFIGFGDSWHSAIHTITSVITLLMMALLHFAQRKYEERILQIEVHQQKVLSLLEAQTEAIRSDLDDLDRYDKLIQTELGKRSKAQGNSGNSGAEIKDLATASAKTHPDIPNDAITSLF